MICIIALIVFAILAIFSARYRPLAAEAFDCVFRRVTLRKCNSHLNQRLKARITGGIMRRHKALGRFFYKYFEVFSWLFLILLVLSLVQMGIGLYNYSLYGNCNGPDETGFCIFDPLGSHDPEVSLCSADGVQGNGSIEPPNLFSIVDHPRVGSASAQVTVIEFGCFSCPNTAEQAPAVKKLIEHFGPDIQFIYVDFPLQTHAYANESTIAGHCVYEQDKVAYWPYHFTLFEHQDSLSPENLRLWAYELGLDMDAYDECITSDEMAASVADDVALAKSLGLYGTPTFFINDEHLIGVKPYKLLKTKVDDALKENS